MPKPLVSSQYPAHVPSKKTGTQKHARIRSSAFQHARNRQRNPVNPINHPVSITTNESSNQHSSDSDSDPYIKPQIPLDPPTIPFSGVKKLWSTPILSLTSDSLNKMDPTNTDAVISMWLIFSKCSTSLENGRRLENISWRLLNRDLLFDPSSLSSVTSSSVESASSEWSEVSESSSSNASPMSSSPSSTNTSASHAPQKPFANSPKSIRRRKHPPKQLTSAKVKELLYLFNPGLDDESDWLALNQSRKLESLQSQQPPSQPPTEQSYDQQHQPTFLPSTKPSSPPSPHSRNSTSETSSSTSIASAVTSPHLPRTLNSILPPSSASHVNLQNLRLRTASKIDLVLSQFNSPHTNSSQSSSNDSFSSNIAAKAYSALTNPNSSNSSSHIPPKTHNSNTNKHPSLFRNMSTTHIQHDSAVRHRRMNSSLFPIKQTASSNHLELSPREATNNNNNNNAIGINLPTVIGHNDSDPRIPKVAANTSKNAIHNTTVNNNTTINSNNQTITTTNAILNSNNNTSNINNANARIPRATSSLFPSKKPTANPQINNIQAPIINVPPSRRASLFSNNQNVKHASVSTIQRRMSTKKDERIPDLKDKNTDSNDEPVFIGIDSNGSRLTYQQRSNTHTSIVRGFNPSNVSISRTGSTASFMAQTSHTTNPAANRSRNSVSAAAVARASSINTHDSSSSHGSLRSPQPQNQRSASITSAQLPSLNAPSPSSQAATDSRSPISLKNQNKLRTSPVHTPDRTTTTTTTDATNVTGASAAFELTKARPDKVPREKMFFIESSPSESENGTNSFSSQFGSTSPTVVKFKSSQASDNDQNMHSGNNGHDNMTSWDNGADDTKKQQSNLKNGQQSHIPLTPDVDPATTGLYKSSNSLNKLNEVPQQKRSSLFASNTNRNPHKPTVPSRAKFTLTGKEDLGDEEDSSEDDDETGLSLKQKTVLTEAEENDDDDDYESIDDEDEDDNEDEDEDEDDGEDDDDISDSSSWDSVDDESDDASNEPFDEQRAFMRREEVVAPKPTVRPSLLSSLFFTNPEKQKQEQVARDSIRNAMLNKNRMKSLGQKQLPMSIETSSDEDNDEDEDDNHQQPSLLHAELKSKVVAAEADASPSSAASVQAKTTYVESTQAGKDANDSLESKKASFKSTAHHSRNYQMVNQSNVKTSGNNFQNRNSHHNHQHWQAHKDIDTQPLLLSPRTGRLNLYAPKLSESVRQNLLWERQQAANLINPVVGCGNNGPSSDEENTDENDIDGTTDVKGTNNKNTVSNSVEKKSPAKLQRRHTSSDIKKKEGTTLKLSNDDSSGADNTHSQMATSVNCASACCSSYDCEVSSITAGAYNGFHGPPRRTLENLDGENFESNKRAIKPLIRTMSTSSHQSEHTDDTKKRNSNLNIFASKYPGSTTGLAIGEGSAIDDDAEDGYSGGTTVTTNTATTTSNNHQDLNYMDDDETDNSNNVRIYDHFAPPLLGGDRSKSGLLAHRLRQYDVGSDGYASAQGSRADLASKRNNGSKDSALQNTSGENLKMVPLERQDSEDWKLDYDDFNYHARGW